MFERQNGDIALATDQTGYKLQAGQIWRSKNSGASWEPLTAPEINITKLQFFVDGASRLPWDQPFVTILIRGVVAAGTKVSTNIDVQTTVSVRSPNYIP